MSTETVKQNTAIQRTTAVLPIEIGTTAAAAETTAMVQARFVMALKKPRNMEQVRLDLIKECRRPSFALEKEEGKGNSALYRRPVGGGKTVEGLGIRFVEVALQCMGNNWADSFTIQESETERVLHVFVLDLEKNTSWGKTITLSKTVERLSLKDGEVPLKVRQNTSNQPTYTVLASEGAFATKEAAEVSKVSRTLGLRLIPGDLQDECIKTIKEVRLSSVVEDPDAAMRKVIDGMAKQRVSVIMLEEFLDHPVNQMTPAEIVNLQAVYASLRDGETTWAEIMADVDEAKQMKPKPKGDAPKEPTKGVDAAKAKIKEEEKKKAPISTESEKTEPEKKPVVQPIVGTAETPKTKPTGKAPASGPPPWATKKSVPAVETATTTQPESLEDQVAAMAAEKKAEQAPLTMEDEEPEKITPVIERKKSKKAVVLKVPMPEFIDRVSSEDAWTDEQYQKLLAAFNKIPASQGEEQLKVTVVEWTGLEIDELNSVAVEALTTALENYKPKS